jgi:hypothetical protein
MTSPIETKDPENRCVVLNYEKLPDECPFCHRSIKSLILDAYLDKRIDDLSDDSLSRAIFQCPRNSCKNIFIGVYELTNFRYNPLFKGPIIYPVFPATIAFSNEIQSISPDFVLIYNQANTAEQYNLQLIAGPGYRKSLEFLIKDYVLSKTNNSQKEEILKYFLGDVISKHLDDSRIKAMAKRATWLGNDETHYLRKWGDKDLGELKTLIDLTVRWIEMSLLSEKYIKEMPE